MIEQQVPRGNISRLWDRFVQVSVPLEDAEQKRTGALFNTMIVVAVVAVLLLFYALFVYPFLTIKVVTKLNAASSFVLYLFSMGLALFLVLGLSFF